MSAADSRVKTLPHARLPDPVRESGPHPIADPLHLHTHHSRQARMPVLCPSHGHGHRRRHRSRLPRRAVAALNGLNRTHIKWTASKGLNQWEHQAFDLAEE
jgi:hypothetical protein